MVAFFDYAWYYLFMKRVDKQRELNEAIVSLDDFAVEYNKTLPPGFPKASPERLRKFQLAYPLLFKDGNAWSIDKHRKRFMDWHNTHH
ncbi:hypothetical protein C4552_03475 [Candidatus Parcubacteria bacterium]|nr:MAG: hypothetical protein C4552_03475 [Candidatus Parcubacteria bacterium]